MESINGSTLLMRNWMVPSSNFPNDIRVGRSKGDHVTGSGGGISQWRLLGYLAEATNMICCLGFIRLKMRLIKAFRLKSLKTKNLDKSGKA